LPYKFTEEKVAAMKWLRVARKRVRIALGIQKSEGRRWLENSHHGRMYAQPETRRDLEEHEVSAEVKIQTFWKKLEYGTGPALSLFIQNEEVLRVDCSGDGTGHLHATFFMPHRGEDRYWLSEKSIEEQVERARFEVVRNWRYYAQRHSLKRVREVKIDKERLSQVAETAKLKMLDLLRLPEMQRCLVGKSIEGESEAKANQMGGVA